MTESETERERIERAEEYCEGYRAGVYAGRDITASETAAGGQSPSYRAGFGEGLAAARRAKYGDSGTERSLNEIMAYAISRLEGDYNERGQSFTDEQSEEWKSWQETIKARGETDWQRILLELYLLLTGYTSGAILAEEERAAVEIVRTGVIRRLSKTKIMLPKVG